VDFSKLVPNAGLFDSTSPKPEAAEKAAAPRVSEPTQPRKEVAAAPAKGPVQDKPLITIPEPPPSLMLPMGPSASAGKETQQSTPTGMDNSPRVTDLEKKNNAAMPSAGDKSAISAVMPPATPDHDMKGTPVSAPWGNAASNNTGSGQSVGRAGSPDTSPMGNSPWSVPPSFAKGPSASNLNGTAPKDSGNPRGFSDSSSLASLDPMKKPARPNDSAATQTASPWSPPAKAVIPPLVVKAPSDESVQTTAPGSADVESYDEESYPCKGNDTFRSISLAYYHTDRYERALQLFNRNHPLAAEALRQDTVVLQSGLNVYIPPKRILDKYYVGAAAVPAKGTADQLSGPQVSSRASAAQGTSGGDRTYRVKNNGEMFREVARNALGDPERWAEIYRLNPRFDPAEPIPSGTDLRLPSQARADARPTP
jgi:hypothetical protein